MATERFFDLCTMFDLMTEAELAPLAAGLGLAARAGQDIPPDLLRAVGTALYAKGVPPAEMDRPFQEALHTASVARYNQGDVSAGRPVGVIYATGRVKVAERD